MTELHLETLDNRTTFTPGETIAGVVAWDFPNTLPPARLPRRELRLLWRTEGKGSQDRGIVDRRWFDQPVHSHAQPFALIAPPGPWSYDGTLLAIVWTLELEAGGRTQRLDIMIRPHPAVPTAR